MNSPLSTWRPDLRSLVRPLTSLYCCHHWTRCKGGRGGVRWETGGGGWSVGGVPTLSSLTARPPLCPPALLPLHWPPLRLINTRATPCPASQPAGPAATTTSTSSVRQYSGLGRTRQDSLHYRERNTNTISSLILLLSFIFLFSISSNIHEI